MGTNLLDCFYEEHPSYPITPAIAKKVANYKASASSIHTSLQEPPMILICRDSTHWTDAADSFLRSEHAKAFKNGTLSGDHDAMAELRTEQDDIRVATLYLTFPLGRAINTKYKVKISQATEVKTDKCRLDLSFNINQHEPETRCILMVIEFKRLGLIKTAEVNAASCRGKG
jgi:hypothetical protein